MRLQADVARLCELVRDSAGPGEAASAAVLAERLRELGAREVRIERFAYAGTYVWAQSVHVIAGLLATWLGRRTRLALSLAALVGLELEAGGRSQWLRRLLPRGEGCNVVGRLPAVRSASARTLVLVAHHDAARTGLIWQPWLSSRGASRRLRRRRIDPFLLPVAAGIAAAGVGLRRVARVLLGAALAAELDVARSPTVPGASDNATGVAGVLELALRLEAAPVAADVIVLLCGCEESGMGGMRDFLERTELDPASTLVLGLDTLGAGEPIVLSGEGALLEHRYGEAELALADRGAARAGQPAPQRWRIGAWTDPVLARHAGIPALSILSIGPEGLFTNYHRLSDRPEHVDWGCAERCVELAWGIVQEWAGQASGG